MQTGLLWYDANPKTTLADKLAAGAAHYAQKHHQAATAVHVHPDTLGLSPAQVPGLAVVPDRTILRDHFWYGRPEPAEGG